MSFEKLKLTSKGRALLAKTGAGGTLTFTKIKMGDGQITSQVIENMTALINEVVALRCNAPQRSGDFVTVTANFKNAAAQDAFTGDGTKTSFKLSAAPTVLTSVKVAGTETTGYTYANGTLTFSAAPASGDIILVTYNLSGFYFREIGFFANDPDEGEIMFAYQNAGSLAEYIAAASSEVIEKTIGATFTFSDSVTVTVEVDDSLLLMPLSQGQYKTELLEEASELSESDKVPVYDVSSQKSVQATLAELVSLIAESGAISGKLDNKVDKVSGKGLSTNDYTNTEKTKLSSLNAAIIVQSSVVVATSAWVSDATYTDYPYRASIPITGCTVNHIPEVVFSLADALSGKFAPVAQTYAGGVYIYASESADITIPTIKLTKVVE